MSESGDDFCDLIDGKITEDEMRKLLKKVQARERAVLKFEQDLKERERETLDRSRLAIEEATQKILDEKEKNKILSARIAEEMSRKKGESNKNARDNWGFPSTSNFEPQSEIPSFSNETLNDTMRQLEEIRKHVANIKLLQSPNSVLNMSSTIFIKEALDSIPMFDGSNLASFVRALRRASDILPDTLRLDFIKLIKNKFRDRAFVAIDNREFDSIEQLIRRLKEVFAPTETLNSLRGKLGSLYKGANKSLLDYISETVNLRDSIIDRMKLDSNVELTEIEIATAESDVIEGFIDGLPPQFCIHLKPIAGKSLSEVFDDAIRVDKRLEGARVKYSLNNSSNSNFNNNGNNNIKRDNVNSNRNFNRPANLTNRPNRNDEIKPETNRNRQDLNTSTKYNSHTYFADRSCKYCKQQGHWIQDCIRSKFYGKSEGINSENDLLARGKDALAASAQPRPINLLMEPKPGPSTL